GPHRKPAGRPLRGREELPRPRSHAAHGRAPRLGTVRARSATDAPQDVLVAWSGGKDSALALREIRSDARYRVAALLTPVTAQYDRISMHGVPRTLLRRQAESVGLPLEEVLISPGASNDEYETNMGAALAAL